MGDAANPNLKCNQILFKNVIKVKVYFEENLAPVKKKKKIIIITTILIIIMTKKYPHHTRESPSCSVTTRDD